MASQKRPPTASTSSIPMKRDSFPDDVHGRRDFTEESGAKRRRTLERNAEQGEQLKFTILELLAKNADGLRGLLGHCDDGLPQLRAAIMAIENMLPVMTNDLGNGITALEHDVMVAKNDLQELKNSVTQREELLQDVQTLLGVYSRSEKQPQHNDASPSPASDVIQLYTAMTGLTLNASFTSAGDAYMCNCRLAPDAEDAAELDTTRVFDFGLCKTGGSFMYQPGRAPENLEKDEKFKQGRMIPQAILPSYFLALATALEVD
ncbi:hypothetical protein EXIGLDRAFT_755278 [Exidia glandulosa HHB12029]|uniref:Uncharacterized protein n=1 Tax=Exidia glandulosa HHB12029 TaxID=1314781 RepID=A0A165C6K7_EXIGL|nr:hypothetical protein EXIGLDRAFT_755278 [Exidia glandulosa HHB12029]